MSKRKVEVKSNQTSDTVNCTVHSRPNFDWSSEGLWTPEEVEQCAIGDKSVSETEPEPVQLNSSYPYSDVPEEKSDSTEELPERPDYFLEKISDYVNDKSNRYLYSKPITDEDVRKFLDRHNVPRKTIQESRVDHPDYYNLTDGPSVTVDGVKYNIECIDVIRNMPTWKGNVFKYLWRCGAKKELGLTDKEKELEDMKKALWYLQDKINEMETSTKK